MSGLHLFVAVAASAILAVVADSYATATAGSNTATATATSGAGYCGGRAYEQWVKCTDSCLPKRCSDLGFPIPCPAHSVGCSQGPGCVCYPGYVRNDKGICVPLKQCPSCGGDPNAECGCGNCRKTCANRNSTQPEVCTELCTINACNCKPGFVLDENTKKCVRPNECTPTCGPDEVFNPCKNRYCGPETCKDLASNITTICVEPPKCWPGCLCKKGYYRNDAGKCVPENQCPSRRCGKNEHYSTCPDDCRPKKCSELGYPIACPGVNVDGSCPSKPDCVCVDGYVRDDKGVCIPIEQCPSCGGDPNARNGCGNCRKTCQNYNSTEPIVCAQYCDPNGCDCKPGYVLNSDTKKCVKPSECPACQGPNEHYEQCPTCTAQKCTEVGFPVPCPPPDSDSSKCPTKPACVCDNGYVRDAKGVCIPKKQCPSCRGDPNAVSGCGSCQPTCQNNGVKPKICPHICLPDGCDCRPGYWYDEVTKKCVLPKDCTKKCGPDEHLDSCANGGCYDARTCKDLDTLNGTYICVDPIECEPGCLCKEGLLRDNRGLCIPEHECPNSKCKGDKERYVPCDTKCTAATCDQLGFPLKECKILSPGEPCQGEPACLCKAGYVKDKYGKCIPKDQCPSCGGDPNAVSGCGVNCGRRCSDYNKGPVACSLACNENGCDCREGYVYDDNLKKCVRPEKCSPVCGQNEVYSRCANAGCVIRNCSQIIYEKSPAPLCVPPKVCIDGCVCADGYLRNNNGVCVPKKECPLSYRCGKNEVYDKCVSSCPPRRCGVNDAVPCIPPNPDQCTAGCRCADGYVRNDQGQCVSPGECPKTCKGDPNARPGCGVNCGRHCSDYNKGPISCAASCYLDGCDCNKDYVYDDNLKKCVLPHECTPVCGYNEEYTSCVEGGCFDARNCSEISNGQKPSIKCVKPIKCTPGCQCQKGHLRNDNGICVPREQCQINDRCSGKDYQFWDDCPPNCLTESCSGIEKPVFCPPQAAVCKPRCRCAPGYYKNNQGVCVPEDQCKKCPLHEVYDLCDAPCPGRSCLVDDRLIKCAAPPKPGDPSCVVGCRCEDGYKRNDKGVCIPKEQCSQSCKGDPNAKPGCGVNCGRHCSDYNKGPVPCLDICYIDGCDCNKDYVYDNNLQKCVLPHECTPVCGYNEEYTSCVEGGCFDARNCSEISNGQKPSIKCVKPIKCTPGCQCQKGHLRNDNGICVPREECQMNGRCSGKDYQFYDNCPPNCLTESCSGIGKPVDCPPQAAVCRPRCRCAPGYYKNNQGVCVPEDQCLKCNKPHEYYSCGGACDNVCSNLSQQNQTSCPIINIKCNEMCYCEEGYARNRLGECVPIPSCRSCKGPHEWYDTCTPNCPPNDSCETYGKSYSCPAQTVPIDTSKCKASCRCEDGYLRNKNGTCIPQEQCPCNGDPNAEPGCCSRTCSDYQANKQPICNKLCVRKSCHCKDGYVLNEKTGKCVLPGDCPQQCGKNEVFDKCVTTCPPRKCGINDAAVLCAPTNPDDCKAGCRCADGYVRNDEGECILPEDCPPKCDGANEVYDPCPSCDPNTCESIGQPPPFCPAKPNGCQGACRCKPGFYRNKINECISKENCLRCTKPNEYYSCGGACDNVCSTLSQQNQTNCPIINVKCNEKCYCEKGYARDAQGNCVPISSCRRCPGVHEWYTTCKPTCPPSDSCDTCNKVYDCPAIITGDTSHCKAGCWCEDNYLRDKNGRCIPKEQCPCNGDPNARPGCGCSRTCSDYIANKPPTCTKDCKINACDCKHGYVLEEKSKLCVLPQHCPGGYD